MIFVLPFAISLQTDASQLLKEIQAAYSQLNYAEAEIQARAALNDYRRFLRPQLLEIHKILGLIYFSQNKPGDARLQFEAALSLDPDLELDPVFVSPKILEFYRQIKGEWSLRGSQNEQPEGAVRYVLVYDPRPAAALRSMVAPGWGQLYKGEKRKGVVLAALWSVGLVGWAATHLARANAEDRYLAERDASKIEARFNSFNTLHKLRNNLLIFSAGVWVYSYFDAILSGKPRKNGLSQSDRTLRILPSASPKQANLTIQVNF